MVRLHLLDSDFEPGRGSFGKQNRIRQVLDEYLSSRMALVRRLPPLGTLRAFEAAARHLSFKEAAKELALTPTAISHQIRLLEEYWGETLFRRRPRPLALSNAGARLFPAIRDGFDVFASALASLGGEAEAKPLRVTTTSSFASRWLVPRLSLWREVHSDIALSIIGVDRVVKLDADEADLAIRYARSAPHGASHEIFRDQFYPVLANPHRTARAGPSNVASNPSPVLLMTRRRARVVWRPSTA
jgi:LysR family transcriptional regulator, glycine cleavage system transcriptional activator